MDIQMSENYLGYSGADVRDVSHQLFMRSHSAADIDTKSIQILVLSNWQSFFTKAYFLNLWKLLPLQQIRSKFN